MGDVRDERATEMDMLVKGLKIVTRCATEDELVAAFAKFCTATTCFIPTRDRRRVGIESLFSLRLADNTVAVRGMCVVRDVWDHSDNPFGRPGIHVAVLQISDDTKALYARIVAKGQPQETARIESRAEMDTVAMPPVIPSDPRASDDLGEPPTDCALSDDGEPAARAATEVDPPAPAAEPEVFPPIADTAVDQVAPARGSIPTLMGMPPPDVAAPRYVPRESGRAKLVSPVRPSRWTRFAAKVRAVLHWGHGGP